MNDFNPFDPDFEMPHSNSIFLKIRNGSYKIRILSDVVGGWEEWTQSPEGNKVYRYRINEKPMKTKDPKKKFAMFWAMIVWNYEEEKIQILNSSKATLLADIRKYSQDPDWGLPQYYDMRIVREGEGNKTKYSAIPLSKSQVAKPIFQAFMDTPISLEALFTGDDPLNSHLPITPLSRYHTGEKAADSKVISQSQLREIMEIIGTDSQYLETLTANCAKHFGIKKLAELPADKFEAVMKSVKNYQIEKRKKEAEEALPF